MAIRRARIATTTRISIKVKPRRLDTISASLHHSYSHLSNTQQVSPRGTVWYSRPCGRRHGLEYQTVPPMITNLLHFHSAACCCLCPAREIGHETRQLAANILIGLGTQQFFERRLR